MRVAGRPTVMVASNNEDTRSLLRLWLEAEGYSVVQAADGQEAVELTRGARPDLILMSERMPRLGALEAMRRIRQNCKECVFPIVVMSTYPTTEARAAAVAADCDSFISQPVDFNMLGSLISRLLHGATGSHQEEAHAGIAASV